MNSLENWDKTRDQHIANLDSKKYSELIFDRKARHEQNQRGDNTTSLTCDIPV